MQVTETSLSGVLRITPQIHEDDRGFFLETWNEEEYQKFEMSFRFTQDNLSRSHQSVLRGIHYQSRSAAQGKLVRVCRGSVYDVAVDLRPQSPTFGQWHGEILSEENRAMLWIPPGFGHGFLVLSNVADLAYKCCGKRVPQAERTLAWNDPTTNISWPIPWGFKPILSIKDSTGISLDSVWEEESLF
jgi:dTDP-4-dehydrorhamnose 3,5-epimerase